MKAANVVLVIKSCQETQKHFVLKFSETERPSRLSRRNVPPAKLIVHVSAGGRCGKNSPDKIFCRVVCVDYSVSAPLISSRRDELGTKGRGGKLSRLIRTLEFVRRCMVRCTIS